MNFDTLQHHRKNLTNQDDEEIKLDQIKTIFNIQKGSNKLQDDNVEDQQNKNNISLQNIEESSDKKDRFINLRSCSSSSSFATEPISNKILEQKISVSQILKQNQKNFSEDQPKFISKNDNLNSKILQVNRQVKESPQNFSYFWGNRGVSLSNNCSSIFLTKNEPVTDGILVDEKKYLKMFAQRILLDKQLFNHLNMRTMLCQLSKKKIIHRNRNSDQLIHYGINNKKNDQKSFINLSQELNLKKTANKRQFKRNFENFNLIVYRLSDSFFESFPFYKRIQHNWNQFTQHIKKIQDSENLLLKRNTQTPNSQFQEKVGRKYQIKENILDLIPNSDGRIFKNSLVPQNKLSATKSVQKGQSDNELKKVFNHNLQEEETPLSKILLPILYDQALSSNQQENYNNVIQECLKTGYLLDELQMEIMEMKIYRPYFMSYSTIIEYQTGKKQIQKDEKLSMADILERHFFGKKQFSRLYFKVNLNDDDFLDNLLAQNYSITNSFCQNNMSSKLINTSAIFKKLILDSNAGLIHEENSNQSSSLNSDFRQKIGIENSQKHSSDSQSLSSAENLSDSQSLNFYLKKGDKKRKDKLIIKRRNSSKVNVQQNLLSISNGTPNSFSIIKRSKSREAGKFLLQKQEIKSKNKILNIKSKDESSKFNNLVLTQTIQMDKSISQDSNSEYSLKLSQKSLQTQAEHLEDNVIYFEFEISQMKLNGEELTLLNIKDVTNLVKNQQKMSDMIYQEALENNFAHEQMTPLNILKANSNFLAKRVFQVHVAFEELMKKVDHQITKENSRKLEENKKKNIMEGIESMKMILTMEQATRGLWYFNQSQIVRMKIKNGHHEKVPLPINDLVQPISHVLQPFELQIQGNQISVYLIKKNPFPGQLIADWKQYQLVLFNMIQNAVKYNSQNGEIIILISCKPVKKKIQEKNNNDQIQMVLGTKIIDTGIGITKERQKLLFIPFLELRSLQGLFKKPENDNIGIGLTNSYIITKQLGGSICIKQSKPGLTIFQFKIPVFSQFDQIISTENQTPEISLLMGNMNKGWKEQTKEYLIEQCQTICLEQVIDNTKNMHKRLEEAFQNSKHCEWSSKSMQDLKLRNMERVKHFQLKRMKNRQNSLKEIEPDSNLIENQAIRSIGTHNHQLNMQPLDQITFNNQPSSNGTNQLRLSFPKDEQSFPIKRAIHRFSGNANSSGFSSKFLNFTSQNLSSFKVSNQQDSSNKFNSNSLNRVENIENNSVDEKTKNEQQNELQLRLIQQKRKRTIKPFSHLNILNSQINSEGAKEISLEDYINDSKKKNPSKKKSAKVKQKQKKESNKLISEPQNNIGIKAKNQSVLEILPILNPPQQAINQPFLLLPRSNEKVLNFDQKSNQSQTLKETPYFIQNQNKVNVFNHQFQKVESSESICKNQIVEQNRFLSKGKIKKNSNRIQSCNLRNSQKLMKSQRQQTFQDLNMRVSESELQIKREQLERIKKQSNNDQIQKVYKLLFNLESSINQSKHQHFQNGIVEINQFDQQKESDHLVQNQEFDQSFEEDNEVHIKQHISQLKLMNLLEVNNPVGFDELGPNLAKYFAFKLASGEANKQILTLLAKIDEVKSNKQNQVSKSSVSLKSVSSSKSSPIKRSGQQNIFKRQPKNLNKSRSDRSSSIKIKNRVLYQNSTIQVQEVQNQDYVSIDCGLNQSFPSSNEQVELEFYQKKKLILQPLNEVPSLFSNIDIEQRLNYTINSLINHFQSNQSLKQNDNFKLILSMTLQQLKQLSSSKIINNCKSCGMNQQDSDGLMIRKLHEELQNLSQESDKIQKSNSQLSAHSQSNQNNDDPVIDTSKSSNSVQFMLQNPICHSLSNTPFTINPNKLFFDQQAVKYNFSQKNDQKKEVIKSFSSQGSNYQNIQEDKMKRESSKLDAIKEEHGVGGLSESLQDEELVSAISSFKLIKMPSYAINAPSEYSYNF